MEDSGKVLLVLGDPDLRSDLATVLRAAGYVVRVIRRVGDLRDALGDAQPDLKVFDAVCAGAADGWAIAAPSLSAEPPGRVRVARDSDNAPSVMLIERVARLRRRAVEQLRAGGLRVEPVSSLQGAALLAHSVWFDAVVWAAGDLHPGELTTLTEVHDQVQPGLDASGVQAVAGGHYRMLHRHAYDGARIRRALADFRAEG